MCKNEQFDWDHCLQNLADEVILDLSQQCITTIPDTFLERCSKLEYLYLEGNELTELSKAFFPSLRHLKWLDIRNNKLTTVPNSIAEHCSLQVLLLEGNQIEALPVEIGSLPSLRGIQLTRNPLVFPPENIVNQGVQSTIDFLRKQWQLRQSPQPMQLISESHTQLKTLSPKCKPLTTSKKQKTGACKSAVILKVNSHEPRKPRKVQSCLNATGLSKCISVQPISQRRQQPDLSERDQADKAFDQIIYDRRTSLRNQEKRKSSVHRIKTNRENADDVQPKLLRDIWIEKIRQLLLTQETILQRRKNAEALKQWQDETKTIQQEHPKRSSAVEINFPYDTDPQCLKMLSRKDLVKDDHLKRRHSSLHHVRHEEPINNKIVSIMAALQELQMSQSASAVSPRTEQKLLAQEIKKIKNIQRSLNALKLDNFGQLGIS